MWPAESWGLGGLGWGGTHRAIRTQPRPDARRLPASAATHRPLCARILTFPSGPRLTSPHSRLAPACPPRDQSICLRGGRCLNCPVAHPPTRTVGHCEIPVDTGVLVRFSCPPPVVAFSGATGSRPPGRGGRRSVAFHPLTTTFEKKVGVVIGHSSTFSLCKPRPQLTSDGQ